MSAQRSAAPLFDIILPTWNRPHTIECSIRSVLAQTVADFRLHVVGDGCGADTEAIVRAVGDPRVSFHRFPKATGFGYVHRNVVLRATDAPFIAYITDDDLWFADHLERGLAELESGALDLVAFRSCHVQFPDALDPHFFAYDWRLGRASAFLRNWFMGSVGCLHRRSVFDVVGYWDDRLLRFGDREFYNRVRTSEAPSRYVDVVTVLRFYAQHWDHRNADVAVAPQRKYLALLADAQWVRRLRASCASGPRTLKVRAGQWADFLRFGIRSGPKFVRFWYQRSRRDGRPTGGARDAPRREEGPATHH
jgi:glycosyltransferase involved in cell wall biosynthesis